MNPFKCLDMLSFKSDKPVIHLVSNLVWGKLLLNMSNTTPVTLQQNAGVAKENGTEDNIIKHDTTSILPIFDSSKIMLVEAFPKAFTAVTLTL